MRREYTSHFGDVVVKGTVLDIIRKWKGLARGAEKVGDETLKEHYLQQAEGWQKKLGE